MLTAIAFLSSCQKDDLAFTLNNSSVKAELVPDTIPIPEEQLPVMAFVGVPQEYGTVARYQNMSADGITQSYVPFSDVNAMEKALNMAQETGIKLFISCPELKRATETTVKRFMNHPALAGYYLADEPGSKDFPAIGALVKKIRAIDNQHICYVNLLPNYATADQLGTKTYQEYLDTFVKEVPIQLLSFDNYPVIGNTSRSIRTDWYKNLGMVSERAQKSGIPFWAFALTTSFSPYPVPTLASLRLQVYSNLAYGAQGIQYFTYWTLTDPAINFNNAPVTRDGNQTKVYQDVQQMSKEIRSLSGIFLGAKMVSVAHTGNTIPAGTKRLTQLPEPIKSLKTDGIGAVVSVMKKEGESFLVVVNRDFTAAMNLKIKCAVGVSKVTKDGLSVPQDSNTNTIKMEPGDIAIFKWSDDLN